MARYPRITKDFQRVTMIAGKPHVLTIGPQGVTMRVLGDRKDTAVPLKWEDLAREGGLLDAAELEDRPLLAMCVARVCGKRRQEAGE